MLVQLGDDLDTDGNVLGQVDYVVPLSVVIKKVLRHLVYDRDDIQNRVHHLLGPALEKRGPISRILSNLLI